MSLSSLWAGQFCAMHTGSESQIISPHLISLLSKQYFIRLMKFVDVLYSFLSDYENGGNYVTHSLQKCVVGQTEESYIDKA